MNGMVRSVGTRCGPDAGGLLVIDVDGPTAAQWMRAKRCDPDCLNTWRINRTTAADRYKLAFRVPEEHWPQLVKGKAKAVTGDGEQIELFWSSGQVLILGEHKKSGGLYTWAGSPATVSTAECHLLELILELLGTARRHIAVVSPEPAPAVDSVPLEALLSRAHSTVFEAGACEGSRNQSAFNLAVGLLTVVDAAAAAGLAVHGTPMHLLLGFASRCSPPLPEREVLNCLRSAESQPRTPNPGLEKRISYKQRRRSAASPHPRNCPQLEALEVGAPPADQVAPDVGDGNDLRGKLARLRQRAADILTSKTLYAERLPILRAEAKTLDLTIRDPELGAMLTAARRATTGSDQPVTPSQWLDVTPTQWLWDGVVMPGRLNLLIALPKQGKTSLVLAWIAAHHRNEPAFLDRTLHGPCPPVLLVGTDQGSKDWGQMLVQASLAEQQGSKVRIVAPLVALHHAGAPLHLDHEGIDRIAAYAQEHPGLLIIIDSFSACVAPLGLKEESPQIAEPIHDLMEQLEPHGATVVLIHHAGKGRAGEGASLASRGSTALPAVASQTIKLGPASANPSDPRKLLTTEGRGGSRLRLW